MAGGGHLRRRLGARPGAMRDGGARPRRRRGERKPTRSRGCPIPRRAAGEALRLLFVGAPYLPNLQAVDWLVSAVLPALTGADPRLLDVVGLSGGEVPAAPGVTAHGRVASVAGFYARAHVAVVPSWRARGPV
jgi:hypothetical protein